VSSQSESRAGADPALFVASLWLRVGFIGASAAATGLLGLIDAESSSLSALALIVSGAILALLGWRRGLSVLEPAEGADDVRPARDIALSPEMIERREQP
jgi:hypothetical protein